MPRLRNRKCSIGQAPTYWARELTTGPVNALRLSASPTRAPGGGVGVQALQVRSVATRLHMQLTLIRLLDGVALHHCNSSIAPRRRLRLSHETTSLHSHDVTHWTIALRAAQDALHRRHVHRRYVVDVVPTRRRAHVEEVAERRRKFETVWEK